MKKLNPNQIRYLLTQWFSQSDLVKIFETLDLGWLCEQNFEISCPENDDWVEVYMDGRNCTSIRTSGKCSVWYEKLLNTK